MRCNTSKSMDQQHCAVVNTVVAQLLIVSENASTSRQLWPKISNWVIRAETVVFSPKINQLVLWGIFWGVMLVLTPYGDIESLYTSIFIQSDRCVFSSRYADVIYCCTTESSFLQVCALALGQVTLCCYSFAASFWMSETHVMLRPKNCCASGFYPSLKTCIHNIVIGPSKIFFAVFLVCFQRFNDKIESSLLCCSSHGHCSVCQFVLYEFLCNILWQVMQQKKNKAGPFLLFTRDSRNCYSAS